MPMPGLLTRTESAEHTRCGGLAASTDFRTNLVSKQFRYIRAVPYIPECEQQPDVKEEEPSSSASPADGWKADDSGSTWTSTWKGTGSSWKKEDPW